MLPLVLGVLTALAPCQEGERWFISVEEVELADLLDACVSGLGLALDYDRGALQGRVSVRSEAGYTSDGIWALANRQLAARKLAIVQPSGEDALAVVPVAEAAKFARVEMDVPGARAGFVKTVRGLHYAEAEKVVEPLRAVLSGEGVLVQPLKEARQVLLAGSKPQVTEALDLLDLLDSPTPPMVAAYPVRHSTPTAVVALVERVTKAMEQVGQYRLEGVALAEPVSGTVLVVAPEPEHLWWQEEIRRFDQALPAVAREYVPRRFGLDETAKLVEEVVRGPVEGAPGWRLVVDELTGTLVVSATPAQHAEVERLLARLEAEPADSRIALRAFSVRHRDVDEFLGFPL
jgi:type II secretory pathway component GspD/PulD (secretin)